MAGKFELYTDAGGKWRFRLKAGNGQVIAVGEAYESKAAAHNGIESIKKNAPDAPVVEV
ncbi:YegP family protein [Microbacterium flavum]|uniref:YegP family protein n=1 Tax=Microbacterium flavum TaxID=415216 RepID=A0ABS5XTW0_9MICO|nr:YegP family protein [Microbacterium flavum]MBT8796563.1 YegP family protein [Microbacterium flavum]